MTTAAATHTIPDVAAIRRAAGRDCSGSATAASTSEPIVSAAARSCTVRTTGSPQRTTAPGSTSPASGACAPWPISRPTSTPTQATAAAGPSAAYAVRRIVAGGLLTRPE